MDYTENGQPPRICTTLKGISLNNNIVKKKKDERQNNSCVKYWITVDFGANRERVGTPSFAIVVNQSAPEEMKNMQNVEIEIIFRSHRLRDYKTFLFSHILNHLTPLYLGI